MSGRNSHRRSKVGLTVGFLALLAAVLLARRAPPTGYELSLYAATPPAVWACLCVALAAGVTVALLGEVPDRLGNAGVLLAGATVLALVTMPLLRGYYFYGSGDALSHLGWARELASGTLTPVNLLYPGVHSTAVFVAAVTGLSVRVALMLVTIVCYTLVFLLFVPLCVRLLDDSRLAVTLGVLSALLLAPVNGVSVHPFAHPTSQAILFFPFVLYLVLRYSTRPLRASADAAVRRGAAGDRVTAVGILLALASSAVVLVHPQQALNVVLFFGAIALVQVLYRARTTDHPITAHRPLYAQTGVLAVAFLLWAPRFERVQGAIVATITSIVFEGSSAGTVVASKGTSLVAVGGSLPSLFVKLFLPGVVLSLLAGGLIVALIAGRLREERTDVTSLLVYVAAALVPLFGLFLLFLVASAGDQYFRYQGFIMVPVTILAAVGLARAVRAYGGGRVGTDTRVVLVVLFLVMVPVGAAAYHSSPYTYQPNDQVTETRIDGFAEAFEHREEGTPFVGIRGGPRRYVDAEYGTQRATTTLDFPGYREGINGTSFRGQGYLDRFEDQGYLIVNDADYEREVRLYDGFRYDAASFRALETTPGVNRIRANDGLRQYLIDGDGA
ncbi:hypothetical protein [Halorarum halobium]|uniref:hypothetical protein n=1 Tax=Halorarum halobium TaxID=3075121 RepID=UPI0028A5A959|nr:hypothetical protein [Halobaculum sp. XH14]